VELEVARGMFVVLSTATELAPIEWELLEKALVQIRVAEVGLHWAEAWEARVAGRVKVERWWRVWKTTVTNN